MILVTLQLALLQTYYIKAAADFMFRLPKAAFSWDLYMGISLGLLPSHLVTPVNDLALNQD